MNESDGKGEIPALGVLALNVEGGRCKIGRLLSTAWRNAPQGGGLELELVAQFSEKIVRVSVFTDVEHARRLGLAA